MFFFVFLSYEFCMFFLAPPPLPGVFIGLVQCVSSYTLSSPAFKGVTR